MEVKRGDVFQRVGQVSPGRSVFNLSYEKKFTCDMGQLIPIMCDEVVPGDIWHIGNQAVVRFQPLVAPIMHEISMIVHYYYVPYRLLWPTVKEWSGEPNERVLTVTGWESYITGGENGADAQSVPEWIPASTALGTLWDYFGFPTGVTPTGLYPVDFPRRAYNFVWNEYYRDQDLQDEVEWTNEDVLYTAWEKDYFTTARPWQQKGAAPSLPVSGVTYADFTNAVTGAGSSIYVSVNTASDVLTTQAGANIPDLLNALNKNQVDLSHASTFDVADLRIAFQIQKWLERNARAGTRYTEFLRAHFGVSPRDDRLDRPEYIGGSRTPIIISEVLQTSEDGATPQGNLAGHGIAVSDSYCGRYRVQEFGLIIGLMKVVPRPAYQQGIDRQWIKKSKYDFYFPEFANLSEQEVYKGEICVVSGDGTHNQSLFGFQGRYNEMRFKSNQVCGQMRTIYDYWHLSRQFDATSSATAPVLNDEFIKCVPRKDVFAAPSEPAMIISFGNLLKAIRPIPVQSEPGLIDHV